MRLQKAGIRIAQFAKLQVLFVRGQKPVEGPGIYPQNPKAIHKKSPNPPHPGQQRVQDEEGSDLGAARQGLGLEEHHFGKAIGVWLVRQQAQRRHAGAAVGLWLSPWSLGL